MKRATRSLRWLATLGLGLILAGCGRNNPEDSTASGLTPVRVQLDWFAQPEHAAFFHAQGTGRFNEAGLAVELIEGGANAFVVERLANNRADVGVISWDMAVMAMDKGAPIIAVGPFHQTNAQALLFHPPHAIGAWSELNGRTVSVEIGNPFIDYIERTYAVSTVRKPHTYSIETWIGSPRLVQHCNVTNEPFYLEQRGLPYEVKLVADAGWSPPIVTVARKDFLADNRAAVEALLKVTGESWHTYLHDDGSIAHTGIQAMNPQQKDAFLNHVRAELDRWHIVEGKPDAGGWTAFPEARLRETVATLHTIGNIRRDYPLHELVDIDLWTSLAE